MFNVHGSSVQKVSSRSGWNVQKATNVFNQQSHVTRDTRAQVQETTIPSLPSKNSDWPLVSDQWLIMMLLAGKIRLPRLHYMVHRPFWGRQGERGLQISSHVLCNRKNHPLLCSWRVFGVEGHCSLWTWWRQHQVCCSPGSSVSEPTDNLHHMCPEAVFFLTKKSKETALGDLSRMSC